MNFKKINLFISISAIIIGIIAWIITLVVDPYTSPFATAWQITWIVNPIGFLLGIYLINKRVKYSTLITVLNLLMTFSFGPMWLIGDLISQLTS